MRRSVRHGIKPARVPRNCGVDVPPAITQAEVNLIRHLRIERGLSKNVVAERVGRSRTTVGRYAPGGRRGKLTPAMVAEIQRQRAEGKSADRVAETMGLDRGTVLKYAPGRPGRAERIARMRELRTQGLSTRHIAAEVGVSYHTVLTYAPNPDRQNNVVTLAERQRIEHLRYVKQMSGPQVSVMVGRSANSVRHIAPGRVRNVDNRSLRLAVECSPVTLSYIARQLDWFGNGRPDVTRVRRALGQKPTTRSDGRRTVMQTIRSDYAAVIAGAIGLAPHEVAA